MLLILGLRKFRCKTPSLTPSRPVKLTKAQMMKKLHLVDFNGNRRFLLEKTQHLIGGFAKLPVPGTPPDILHSFMGLASLALMREEGLNRLDPTLCISMQAKERLVSMDWWRGAAV